MTLQHSRSVSQPSPKLSNLRQNMIGTWSRIFSANGLSTFAVQNRWLSTLKLEPPAEFRTSITVESGSVYSIDASLSRSMDIYPTFQASAGMVEEYLEYPARPADRRHYEFPTPVGKPYLRVRLDSHATPIQRQHAFGFSFDCLIKPGGGCDVPAIISPHLGMIGRPSCRTPAARMALARFIGKATNARSETTLAASAFKSRLVHS